MNEPGPIASNEHRPAGPVFVSYATADRKDALAVCKAIERRGIPCWISTRDVPPGANYQEAIVRALRDAPAMVLIFSSAANSSDEIKKELSLASRYRIPVIALRIENVEPSDAFAYELSTRQWIDAFQAREKSIDSLVSRIGQISDIEAVTVTAATPVPRRGALSRSPMAIAAAAGLLLLVLAAGLWWWLRPAPAAAHGMTVRLVGFQTLSADLPATMRETVDAEIAAAFNADGVVGVSTASAAAAGTAPAYGLGGTIQRDGNTIHVITRLTNERSGTTLWTDKVDYDGNAASAVPRHIAVDTGNVVRCGLFGASTYRKPLPDPVLRDYMQFCKGHWDPNLGEGRKALVPAQRVVAAVPDFSWGWAAVAGAYWKVARSAANPDEARALGRQAADRAIALDPRNSEAMYIKAVLTDRQDWLGRESLFKRAIAARRLDCGCEHHQYGTMLLKVGRTSDAVDQLRQANDMLALYVYTPLSLADALVVAGKPEEARQYFDAAIGLSPDAAFAERMALFAAAETSDEGRLLKLKSPASAELRVALLNGLRAKGTGDAGAKGQAVRGLLAVPENLQNGAVAWLLADLGAKREAFDVAARLAGGGNPGPSVFWHPSMRGTLSDPAFPALAQQLGLMTYWKASHTKPDVCAAKDPPPFCRMI